MEVCYLGLENTEGPCCIDLNEPLLIPKTFDLVHCAHVLEHVAMIETATRNLLALTSPGGFLWINAPSSAIPHGSPDFFYAGIRASLFERLFSQDGAQIASAEIGSVRQYFFEHLMAYWPSLIEYERPLWSLIAGRAADKGSCNKAKTLMKQLFPRLILATCPKGLSANERWATQTVFLLQKSVEENLEAPGKAL